MIVIFGQRYAGTVDRRGGQCAETQFVHLYYLPCIPLSSIWILDEESRIGHAMKLHWRSVLAAYARSWSLVLALVAAVIATATTSIGLGIAAVALFVLGLAALAWRSRPGIHAQKRSDMNHKAFGTRCEPHLMTREMVDERRAHLETRWAAMANGQTPGDVARFGADNPEIAVVAYGLLRITAVTLPPAQAAEAEAQAARIVDDLREDPNASEGPYRQTA